MELNTNNLLDTTKTEPKDGNYRIHHVEDTCGRWNPYWIQNEPQKKYCGEKPSIILAGGYHSYKPYSCLKKPVFFHANPDKQTFFKKSFEHHGESGQKQEWDFVKDLLNLLRGITTAEKDGWCIAGGYVNALLSGHDRYDDIDIFFAEKAQMHRFCNRAGIQIENPRGRILSVSWRGRKLNLIAKNTWFTGNVYSLLSYFDLTVGQCALVEDGIITSQEWQDCYWSKNIQLHHIHTPLKTLRRVFKYMDRGYTMSLQDICHLTELVNKQASGLNLDKTNIFVGVR